MAHRPIDTLLRTQTELGLNDTATAKKLQITKQRLTNWKKRGIPPRELPRVARFCQMTVDELLGAAPAKKTAAKGQGKMVLHGYQVTPEEVEVGIEWGKLTEPLRSIIKQQIYLLVAERRRQENGVSSRTCPVEHPEA